MKWKGKFNYHGEVINLETENTSPDGAFVVFVHKIAKKVGTNFWVVYNYFRNKDNFSVEKMEE